MKMDTANEESNDIVKEKFEVPLIWDAALFFVASELDRIMWNIYQKPYDSPFENTGTDFSLAPVFEVYSYSWNDDYEQPFNFKWKNVEISWYKRCGRGMTANRQLLPEEAEQMLQEILPALLAYEKANDERTYHE